MATWTEVSLFDGDDEGADKDPRLRTQLVRVYEAMCDGWYHTLPELATIANASEASVSARMRDLRKPRFGGFALKRKLSGNVSGPRYYYKLYPDSGDPALVYDPQHEPRPDRAAARKTVEAWLNRSMIPSDLRAAIEVLLR
jgi:hypothetical protein